MSISKISVDIRQRTFSIEVPDERVDTVLERIEALFKNETSSNARANSAAIQDDEPTPRDFAPTQSGEPTKPTSESGSKKRGKGPIKTRS